MASITKEVRNGKTLYRVEWRDIDGRRKKIRLGELSKADAESIRAKVASIVSAQAAGNDLPVSTALWLNGLGDVLHDKLAAQGLAKVRQRITLSEWLAKYTEQRSKEVKQSTFLAIERSSEILGEKMGSQSIKSISPEQCKEFRENLAGQYAQATVAKIIKHCKQFFSAAVKAGLLSSSPFAEVRAGTQVNEDRSIYVSSETIEKAIASAPDAQWRLIIALCRYGGLRCKSEILALRWCDVDFVKGEMTIHSSKTEGQGKAKRQMPILPALRPYLEDAFDPESERVITRYRESNSNLRKMFLQILAKAGIEPWPRLFHNLRGSIETDLLENFAIHNVVKWMGHSDRTALKHYAKVSSRASDAAKIFDISGVGRQVGPKTTATASVECNGKQPKQQKTKDSANPKRSRKKRIGRAGLEPATKGL